MKEYNFNDHLVKKLINKYGGSERKETIFLDDGYEYLLKLPDPTREKNRMLSYINNSISEYIGCKIMEQLKFPVQKVILGEYATPSSRGEKKKYIACACRNIEQDGYSLAEAERTTLGSDENTRTAIVPSFETIEEIAKYTSDISLEEIEKFYAEMFIGDAFIGNRDRHNGNWGFLTGIKGNRIAPIYDCGSSLCPMYDDSQLSDTIAKNEANNGLSVIRDIHGKQIVYKDFLFSAKNKHINDALKSIVPRIHMDEIIKIVRETPYISEVRKEFYEKYLSEKYQKVLLPALEKVHNQEIEYRDRNCLAEELYQKYCDVIKPMSDVPLDRKVHFIINGMDKIGIRASSKYFIITNAETEVSEAIISVRSNNSESWKSLQTLAQTYNVDIEHLTIITKNENMSVKRGHHS